MPKMIEPNLRKRICVHEIEIEVSVKITGENYICTMYILLLLLYLVLLADRTMIILAVNLCDLIE